MDDVDLVVVGAGASGLLAAVGARRMGLDVLVVESTSQAGGVTATSDGKIWLPGNQLARKLGVEDSTADALAYLDAVLGPVTASSTEERRGAFAHSAGRLAHWLMSSNVPLAPMRGASDFHPGVVGAKTQGRVVAAQPTDRRGLGPWASRLRSLDPGREPGRVASLPLVNRVMRPEGVSATRGEALVAELLRRATANGVEVWFDCPLVDLVDDHGRVGGVVVRHDGEDVAVNARRGVLLACGGFEANQELREEYLPLPTDAAWSLHAPGGRGEGITLAMSHGAGVAGMDDAWWVPVILADGRAYPVEGARRAPHGIIVDQAGDRFFDEAAAPGDAVRAFFDRRRTVRTVPSYLVMDNRHRRATDLGPWPGGATPRTAVEADDIVRSDSLTDLAQALGVDRAGLLGTVVRFNSFAMKGDDHDFHRGDDDGHAGADHAHKRHNPSLGKLGKSPYWAVRVYPGDEGTKGGLLVDSDSRVLRPDESPIENLYACGGTAASIMTGTSPGPGAALGEALVQAYRAVLHIGLHTSADQ